MPYRQPFPIPEDIHAEPFCLCIQVPNDPTWKQAVAGLLYEMNHWFNWQRDDERSGKECAQVWRNLYNQIDWSTMSCCCDQTPVQYRYTSDGILQKSTDAGVTWTDAPNDDPRNYSPQFPPMSGEDSDDKKCLAATGATALIKEQIGNQLTDDMSRYTLGQLITDWVKTYIETSNPFQALLTVIVNQIFALVIAVLRPALTDSVYDDLQCILYCNIAFDASYNNAQWEAVRAAILTKITGIAGVFLEHLVYLLGSVGLTNLARASGATTGDCSGCGCFDCDSFNFITSDEAWVAGAEHGNPGGEWVDGLGWRDTYVNLDTDWNNYIHIESPYTACEGTWDIDLEIYCIEAYGLNVHAQFANGGYSYASDFTPTTGSTYHLTYPGVTLATGAPFVIKLNSAAVQIAVKKMTLTPSP